VQGTDLGRVIAAEGRVAPERAVGIVAQLTSALDAAHARGLVHRDVKPANVLIAREGGGDHVYLTDFGLAKFAVGGGVTRTGMFVGTIDFAAPEQFEGRRVDARTDVYAAGCVLYNMLTGSVPFPRQDDVAIMWAHMSSGPPSVRELVPSLPGEFDAVIARAMAKDPDQRYQSAGDLGRDALAAAQRQHASLSEHSVATGRAAPTVRDAGGQGASTEIASPAPPPGSPPVRPPADRPRTSRSRGLIAALGAGAVVVIAALALAASGAFSSGGHHTTTSTTTATTPKPPAAPTTKTFTDLKLGISFAYPASWQPLTLSGTVADFGTNPGPSETRCALVWERGVGPASSSQQAQLAYVRMRSAFAASLAKHYEVLAIEAQPGANVAGIGLLRIDDTQGGHIGFFFQGRDIYVFDCITPAATLTQVDQRYFQPLLASVRIG